MATTAKTSSSKTGKTTTTAPKKTPAAASKAVKTTTPAAKAAAPAAKKPTVAKAPAKKAARKVDPILRQHYIEVAAYYIAERRGFLGGCAKEDWVQAEIEIDQLLADKKLSA